MPLLLASVLRGHRWASIFWDVTLGNSAATIAFIRSLFLGAVPISTPALVGTRPNLLANRIVACFVTVQTAPRKQAEIAVTPPVPLKRVALNYLKGQRSWP